MASLVYNSFLRDQAIGAVDVDTDSFKILLINSTYAALDDDTKKNHTKRSDVNTNEVTGTNYTAGGSSVSLSNSLDTSNNLLSVTLGGTSWANSTITAYGAVYYKSRGGSASSDELVAYVDFGQAVTTSASTFSLNSSLLKISNPPTSSSLVEDITGCLLYTSVGGGTVDEAATMQAALDAAAAAGKTLRFQGTRHKISSSLHWDYEKHSIEFDRGFELYTAGVTGYAFQVYQTSTSNDSIYRAGPSECKGLRILGTQTTGEHGLLIGDVSLTATNNRTCANVLFTGLQLESLDDALTIGGNGYLARFVEPKIFRSNRCIYLPSATNSGERITFHGGTVFNSNLAVQCDNSNGSLAFLDTSMDYNEATFLQSAGTIDYRGNWEFAGNHTGQQINITGKCAFNMDGGIIIASTSTTWVKNYFLTSSNVDAYVRIRPTYMFGILPLVAIDNGTAQHDIKPTRVNDVSNVKGLRRIESSLMIDPTFESTGAGGIIKDFIWINSDTVTITDRFSNASGNIALTVSSAHANDGTVSLRVAKAGAGSTNASFYIAVPVSHGDRIWHDFYMKNPDNRSGAITVSARWAKINGTDGSGIPVVGHALTYGSYNVSPTTSFVEYRAGSNVFGDGEYSAPDWATHHLLQFNASAFVGGSGATEGGNFSFYIDTIGIYRW